MRHITISHIQENLGQKVLVKGWVYNIRSSGSIIFLQFRDGGGMIQAVVLKNEVNPKVWKNAKKITMESSVELIGIISKDQRSVSGFEMQVQDIKIIHIAKEYPIAKKEHGVDFLMDNRHLWLRSARQWAIQRVRSTIIDSIHKYLQDNSFVRFDSPIFTPTSCENTTELFEVDYFKKEGERLKAYLSQSGQLYLEAGIFAHGRVYDFGPVFRAEKSKTRRHLTEFWMMDAEAAFVEHEENMHLQEELICHIIKTVLNKNKDELVLLRRDVSILENIQSPFPRITHAEIVQELQAMGSDIKENEDLGGDDETLIMQKYTQPIFVEKYPAQVKAFYMKRDHSGVYALCSDLLAPEGYGEIIGGSQREDDYDTLGQRIDEFGLERQYFKWYLDLRQYGSVPHSGFGLGLERVVAWLCGVRHVRETIPFPRTISRLRP